MSEQYKVNPDPEARVGAWVFEQTRGVTSAIELGCGAAAYLKCVPTNKRLGIDIFEPYVERCRELYDAWGIKFVLGDFRDYKKFMDGEYECALLIDSLEHVPKEDGIKVLLELQGDVDKILVFTPLGYVENDSHDGNPNQVHLSGWYPSDLEDLGFSVFVDHKFHTDKPAGHQGAIYAVWRRH